MKFFIVDGPSKKDIVKWFGKFITEQPSSEVLLGVFFIKRDLDSDESGPVWYAVKSVSKFEDGDLVLECWSDPRYDENICFVKYSLKTCTGVVEDELSDLSVNA